MFEVGKSRDFYRIKLYLAPDRDLTQLIQYQMDHLRWSFPIFFEFISEMAFPEFR